MPPSRSPSQNSLLEERVAALDAIVERRNVFLRQIHDMLWKRDNVGTIITTSDDSDEGLSMFLERFDMNKNPYTASITNLTDEEISAPLLDQATSPSDHSDYEPVLNTPPPEVTPAPPSPPKFVREKPLSNTSLKSRRSKSRALDLEAETNKLTCQTSHTSVGRYRKPLITHQEHDIDSDDHDELDLLRSGPSFPKLVKTRHSSRSTATASHSSPGGETTDEIEVPEMHQPTPDVSFSSIDDDADPQEVEDRDQDVSFRSPPLVFKELQASVKSEAMREEGLSTPDVLSEFDEAEEPKVEGVSEMAVCEADLEFDEEKEKSAEEVLLETGKALAATHSPPAATELLSNDLPPVKQELLEVDDESMSVDGDIPEAFGVHHPETETVQSELQLPEPVSESELDETAPETMQEAAAFSSRELDTSETVVVEKIDSLAPPDVAMEPSILVDPDVKVEPLAPPDQEEHHPPPPPLYINPQAISLNLVLPPARPPVLALVPNVPVPCTPFIFADASAEASAEQQHSTPSDHPSTEIGYRPSYTLPPLKALPAEYQRKNKKGQRKRDKLEKERGERGLEKGDSRRDEWTPMGLNKWSAILQVNPVWDKVARSAKCLSTRDWAVAMTELTLLRSLERIEMLKKNQQWSFRQPKKQRGIGGLMKTHWDYLMDEVKWMRTDFREERKWKLALAYELASEVVRWHRAGSTEERVKQGICVKWKPNTDHDIPMEEADDDNLQMLATPPSMDVDYSKMDRMSSSPIKNSLLMVDYASDDEEDEEEADKEIPIQDLDITHDINAAIEEDIRATSNADDDNAASNPFLELKREEIEDPSAMQIEKNNSGEVKTEEQTNAADLSGLKSSSDDPLLGSQPISRSSPGEGDGTTPAKSKSKALPYPQLREQIAYADDLKLFLALEDLVISEESRTSSDEHDSEPKQQQLELSSVFPDLQPYDFLDVASPVSFATEGKRKSDRRSDRDDPHKRAEDTTYSKLTPVTKQMFTKPTLLGPLQPARRWKNGKWVNMDEPLPVPELDPTQMKYSSDAQCDLFNAPRGVPPMAAVAKEPEGSKEQRKRALHNEDTWTPRDDMLLKSLVDKYRTNWALITECINSMRPTALKADRRTKWECYNRWNVKFGSGARGVHLPPQSPLLGSPSAAGQMTTRGVKRLASHVASPIISGGSAGVDSRKRRHHLFVQDAIRKTLKKRESAQKTSNQRKSSAVHDTHGQFTKMPKLSPAELNRMKAEKDTRDAQQELAMRRRNDELRQHALMQARGGQVPPNVPGAQITVAQAAGQRPAVPPGQGMPQIRNQVNISQQQRIPTPLANGIARTGSPLIIGQRTLQQAFATSQGQAQVAQGQQVSPQLANQAQLQQHIVAAGMNGATNHLSQPYPTGDATAAVAQGSPPRSSATPSQAISPRPTSAQASIAQVPSNALPRSTTYYPVVPNMSQPAHYTQEQMHAMQMNLMLKQAQQAQQAQQQAQQQALAAQGAQQTAQSPQYPS